MACSRASDSPSWKATRSPMPWASTRRSTRRGTVSPATWSEIMNGPPTSSPSSRTRCTWGTATPARSASSRTPASASIGLMIVSPSGTIVATRRRVTPSAVASKTTLCRRAPAVTVVMSPIVTVVPHASPRYEARPARRRRSTHSPCHRSWPGLATARSARVISTSASHARPRTRCRRRRAADRRARWPGRRRRRLGRGGRDQLPFASGVGRAEPELALDDAGQVGGDAHLVLQVRGHGGEDVLVEQPPDRRQQVGSGGRELHGLSRSRRRPSAPAASCSRTCSRRRGASGSPRRPR